MARAAAQVISSEASPSARADADWGQSLSILSAAGLTITLWALTPVTTRLAAVEMDGISIGLLRTMGAGVIALPLILILRLAPPVGFGQWRQLLLSAAGSFAVGPVLFSLGTAKTSASHAALIMAAMPLFAGLIAAAMERKWPSALWSVGATVALLGEAALIGMRGKAAGAGATASGDAIVLIGCIAWAGGFVAGARLTRDIGPWRATFWALVVASLSLTPLAYVYLPLVSWPSLSSITWGALVHISIGASLVAYVAWFWAMAHGGIGRVAVLQFAQPPLALLFAVLLLGELPTLPLALASSAIIAGIVIARHR